MPRRRSLPQRDAIASTTGRPNPPGVAASDFLAWGTSPETLVILRHMLPDPAFTHAIQRVEKPEQLVPVVGEYLPTGTYTTKTTFESLGC